MAALLRSLRLKLPFMLAGFASFVFSVWLYFVEDDPNAAIFVGLWVPSIHSLGTLLLSHSDETARTAREAVST